MSMTRNELIKELERRGYINSAFDADDHKLVAAAALRDLQRESRELTGLSEYEVSIVRRACTDILQGTNQAITWRQPDGRKNGYGYNDVAKWICMAAKAATDPNRTAPSELPVAEPIKVGGRVNRPGGYVCEVVHIKGKYAMVQFPDASCGVYELDELTPANTQ